ncbi:MAG: S41 family peptidase [Rectinemataceae bacterium]|nr:S41 family peptidase [Spirochaetaceae bacterium]
MKQFNSRRSSSPAVVAALLGVLILLTFASVSVPELQAQQTKTPDAKQYSQMLQSIYAFILQNYVDEPDPALIYQGAIKGMLDALGDPYSTFLDEDMMSDLMTETEGTYGGVGLYISKQRTAESPDAPRYIEVVSPIEDTPAWKEGIKPGDLIIKIDGEDTAPLSTDKASAKIRGTPGTKVTLTFRRGSYEFEVTFTRSRIEIPAIKSAIIETAEGRTGYLRIIEWIPQTAQKVKAALTDMQARGVQRYIVDVRSNPGGLLSSVIDVSDLFIDKGVIVSTRGRVKNENTEYKAKSSTAIPVGNRVIVLINQGSASASEIFAGAMKDSRRALLLGEKTYGKGSVQQIFPLDKVGFKLTMARYYTPSGVNIDKTGIMPDIEVKELTLNDTQLASLQKLYESGEITRFLQRNPNPDKATREAFANTLAEQWKLPAIFISKIIRDEAMRTEQARIYDLEFDTQLLEAIRILHGETFDTMLQNAKTLADRQG